MLAFIPGAKAVKGLKAVGGSTIGMTKIAVKKGDTLYRLGGYNKELQKSFKHGQSYTTEKLPQYMKREIKAGTGPLNPDNPANTIYRFKATKDFTAYSRTSKGGYFEEIVILEGGSGDILQMVMSVPVYDL